MDYCLEQNLIILLSRLTKTSIEDISRYGISNWCRTMLYWEHRRRNMIIPTQTDLELSKGKETNVKSVIAGKGFKGAFVLNPVKGIHFNVVTCTD